MKLSWGWKWFPLSDDGGMDGSAITKIFKASEHHSASDLLAREVIQNSWDAATLLRKTSKNPKLDFSIEFRFISLSGRAKEKFLADAKLKDLQERVSLLPKSQASKNLIATAAELSTEAPLRLLFCIDNGGHGLYGHPSKRKASILYRALYQFGGTTKDVGDSSGGSFGFGKSAFVRGSRLRTVFAYSSFAALKDDSVTRRLVGFTWWESHTSDDEYYDGRAIFGDAKPAVNPKEELKVVPFEDTFADAVALNLNFPGRSAETLESYGTSLLLVEPTMTAEQLRESIERYWWPALTEVGLNFSVSITDEEGNKTPPRPRQNQFVRTFLPIYSLAVGEARAGDPKREQKFDISSQTSGELGSVAFRVLDGDSLEIVDQDSGESHSSLVALMRDPRMVIEYRNLGPRRIPFHGVFVANSNSDNLLRETENAEHNSWSQKESEDISFEATSVAHSVISGISRNAKKFMNDVSPPPSRENSSLAHFANLLGPFLKGTLIGPTPPPVSKAEPIEIRFLSGPSLSIYQGESIRTTARVTIQLSTEANQSEVAASVGVDFRILEDDGDSGSEWEYSLNLKSEDSNFEINENGGWDGILRRGIPMEFEFESDPYDMNWTGQLKILVDMVDSVKELVNG
jgi:hypothetical protein